MKQLLFFLLVFSSTFAQKKYAFDYIAEYEFQANEKAKVEKRYLLTNSKDCSYGMEITEIDFETFGLHFCEKSGIVGNAVIKKSDFYRTESITIDCNSVWSQDFNKYPKKFYTCTIGKDTLLDGIAYKQYQFHLVTKKKKKSETGILIVENNTDFHLPSLFNLDKFVQSGCNIPNGILKERILVKKKKEMIYKLKKYSQIQKYFIIPAECKIESLLATINKK